MLSSNSLLAATTSSTCSHCHLSLVSSNLQGACAHQWFQHGSHLLLALPQPCRSMCCQPLPWHPKRAQSPALNAFSVDNSSYNNGNTGHSSHQGSSVPSNSGSKGPFSLLARWRRDSQQLKVQLQSLGVAGIVAYGLFNTAYYTCAFLFVWYTMGVVPAGLGYKASARKAAEVFAMVWAGSQVTKLLRAGGALALAPILDKGLDLAVAKIKLKDKRQAFTLLALACIMLATAVFGTVVVMHA